MLRAPEKEKTSECFMKTGTSEVQILKRNTLLLSWRELILYNAIYLKIQI